MTKKANILLISIFLTIAAFIYLSLHHYSIKVGLGGHSLCSLNSKLNCDAAAVSSFSEIFKIPIAVLGGVFHFIMFSFVLFYRIGLIEESSYLKNTLRFQFATAAIISLVMGGISLVVIKVACPFCVATYILSFINLALGWNLVTDTTDKFNLSGYINEYKSHLIALAAIPFISWTIAGMTSSHYGLDQINKYFPEKIAIWKASNEYSFSSSIGITNKVDNPKFTLVEFADFKCPHCKVASNTLKTFLSSRNDIQFIFKPYPLDGNCNPMVSTKGDGSRCALAGLALCSEKLAGKGLEVTHWLFDRQETLFNIIDIKKITPDVESEFNISAKSLDECIDATETYEALVKSTQEGGKSNVEGTPTIYLNGKKLPWGHMIDMLKAATEQ